MKIWTSQLEMKPTGRRTDFSFLTHTRYVLLICMYSETKAKNCKN
jgi:hypothetical protein